MSFQTAVLSAIEAIRPSTILQAIGIALLLGILLVLGAMVWHFLIWPNIGPRRVLKQIPCEPRHWLYGHLNIWTPGPKGFPWFLEMPAKYKDLHILWLGPAAGFVIPTNPEIVQKVVAADPPKSNHYHVVERWLGNGLLTINGAAHRPRRKMLTPSFHFGALKSYFSVYTEQTAALVQYWREHSKNSQVIDIQSDLAFATLDIIGKCAFGVEFDALHNRDHEFVAATLEAAALAIKRLVNPLLAADIVYFATANGRKFSHAVSILHRYADEAIDARAHALEVGRTPESKDFLDILLSARDEDGNPMSKREMRDEVSTFMFEGHDTTSSGLQWTLYLLAAHPEVQARVHEEVDSVFGNRSELTFEDISKLSYLDRVLKESHRHYPPVPSVSRVLQEPLHLDCLAITLPRGTPVAIHPQSVHHSPANYPDPMRFDPDRFLPEEIEKRHPFAYIPFSAGSRNCIGQKFALLEEKVVIATVLHEFELGIPPSFSLRPMSELVIRNDGPLELSFTPRR